MYHLVLALAVLLAGCTEPVAIELANQPEEAADTPAPAAEAHQPRPEPEPKPAPPVVVKRSPWPDKYDWHIKKAANHWLPMIDWRLYKAQLIQESALNPRAVSPAGAQGLAQFMPGTWPEWERHQGRRLDPFDPAASIEGGAWYMMRMRGIWTSPRPEQDRHNLALASYNAGAGNIIKAQKRCQGAVLYPAIMACLPAITGHHAKETLGYAPRIRDIHRRLLL